VKAGERKMMLQCFLTPQKLHLKQDMMLLEMINLERENFHPVVVHFTAN
jgi:hypothetical protein